MYTPEQRKLAQHIAKTLHDWHSIGQHLKFTKLYTKQQLLDTLAHVMAIPDAQITHSRAALFMSIIKQYDISEHDY
jgi:hypothetical protein